MDLTTTNDAVFLSHPKQPRNKTLPREDHTSTFLDKDQVVMGCSTYMRSYIEKPDACRLGCPQDLKSTAKQILSDAVLKFDPQNFVLLTPSFILKLINLEIGEHSSCIDLGKNFFKFNLQNDF